MLYSLEYRPTETIALDEGGWRIGEFDRAAGASRGTLRGRTVARTYDEWLEAISAA